MESGSAYSSLATRVTHLERRLRRTQVAAAVALAAFVGVLAGGRGKIVDSLRARRIALVDDRGVERVVLAQDPSDSQRRSRSCGISLHDTSGAERGGFATFDDRSVVLALDAPPGVGHSMRDRVGLGVDADGSAHVSLIDNETQVPVRLKSDPGGGGGLEFIGYDLDKGEATVKRLSFAGESVQTLPLGDRQ